MGLEGTASVSDGVSMFDWRDLLICKITILHLIKRVCYEAGADYNELHHCPDPGTLPACAA